MKINKVKFSKKKLFIPLAGLFLLTGLVVAGMYHYQIGIFQPNETLTENQIDLQRPTDKQIDAGTLAKNDFSSRPTEASQERAAANGETLPSSENESVQTIISSSNMNGVTLSVRSIIQTIDSSGECILTLSKAGSQSISKKAGTNTIGSYSTCAGFDIDTSTLSKGEWEIKLVYSGSQGQSGSATKKVTL